MIGELAILNAAMARALEGGFSPMITPTLVRPDVMAGTGFLGKHAEEIYYLERDELYLTGTSEVALAGYHGDEIVDLGGAIADAFYAGLGIIGVTPVLAKWPSVPPILYAISGVVLLVYGFLTARSQPVTPVVVPDESATASQNSIIARRELAQGMKVGVALIVLNPAAMVCHCAAHMLADGDLQGGLRNLWDFHCLVLDFLEDDPDFYLTVIEEASVHGLVDVVKRAFRLSHRLYGTPLKTYSRPLTLGFDRHGSDNLYIRRLLARDDWGRVTHPLLERAFYIRSHWLRMPPVMLAKHLWTKWRKA